MGEPLKGKKRTLVKNADSSEYYMYADYDIKSVVEWLKSNLKDFEGDARKVIYDKIDQAFPDLIHDSHIKSTRGKEWK